MQLISDCMCYVYIFEYVMVYEGVEVYLYYVLVVIECDIVLLVFVGFQCGQYLEGYVWQFVFVGFFELDEILYGLWQ